MPETRCALYARTSTSTGEKQDPETQLLDLRKLAAAKGWTIVAEFVDRMSGATERRPGLDALMRAAHARKFEVVMVHRFDRMARSTRFLLETLQTFRKLQVDFVSYTEAIDTSSAVGELIFSVLAAIGSFERELIRSRVRAGLRRAKSEGKRLGRPKTVWEDKVNHLRARGLSVPEIQTRLKISRTAVYRVLRKSQKPA